MISIESIIKSCDNKIYLNKFPEIFANFRNLSNFGKRRKEMLSSNVWRDLGLLWIEELSRIDQTILVANDRRLTSGITKIAICLQSHAILYSFCLIFAYFLVLYSVSMSINRSINVWLNFYFFFFLTVWPLNVNSIFNELKREGNNKSDDKHEFHELRSNQ